MQKGAQSDLLSFCTRFTLIKRYQNDWIYMGWGNLNKFDFDNISGCQL